MKIASTSVPTLQWNQSFPAVQTPIVALHFPDRQGSETRHAHDFMEIQLCARGRGEQQVCDGTGAFNRGDAVFLRPGAWHAGINNSHVDAYVCCFGTSLLRHELLWTLDEPALNFLLWRQSPDEPMGTFRLHLEAETLRQCLVHWKALVALGEIEKPGSRPLRIGYLTLILATLAEAVPVENLQRQTDAEPVHSAVKRALGLLAENLGGEWTSGGLAKKLNIDVSYLGRLFRKTLGFSPMSYLAQVRAEQAARLLLRTEKTISEIAVEIGWPDPNHFARRFRTHFGISASEYRFRFAKKTDAS